MSFNILVLGDVMLDIYIKGIIDHISPEAPVPVMFHKETYNSLGGAANLAANIKSLGGNPIVLSTVGSDLYSDILDKLLTKKLIHHELVTVDGFVTTTKTRIMNNGFHLLRIDNDNTKYLTDKIFFSLMDKIRDIIIHENIHAVALSDYNKGFLPNDFIMYIIALANEKSIPVFADPKKINFSNYRNINCLKPNAKEFSEYLGVDMSELSHTALYAHMHKLLVDFSLKSLVVTGGKIGAFLVQENEKEYFAAPELGKSYSDSAGAGDTFLAALILGYLNTHSYSKSTKFAVMAASSTCKKAGVVEADMNEIIEMNNDKTFFS